MYQCIIANRFDECLRDVADKIQDSDLSGALQPLMNLFMCMINGYDSEYTEPIKRKLTIGLPARVDTLRDYFKNYAGEVKYMVIFMDLLI